MSQKYKMGDISQGVANTLFPAKKINNKAIIYRLLDSKLFENQILIRIRDKPFWILNTVPIYLLYHPGNTCFEEVIIL
jgi:hypothetical protein